MLKAPDEFIKDKMAIRGNFPTIVLALSQSCSSHPNPNPNPLANPFVYGSQRMSSTVLTLGSSVLSAHLFVGEMLSTTSFLSLASCSILSSTLLQTGALYPILYFPATHATSTHYP